jgi:hypothetical protein
MFEDQEDRTKLSVWIVYCTGRIGKQESKEGLHKELDDKAMYDVELQVPDIH